MSTDDAGQQGVSIVICSRNRPQFLGEALAALKSSVRAADEVVVVDSASITDETAAVVRAAGYRVVRLERPGLSKARNAGIAATSRPLVAFTDDDCLPAPTWVGAVADAFADACTGAVMGRLTAEQVHGHVPADDPGDHPFVISGAVEPAELGAGANMAFRRDALEAVGGFDESLGAGTPLRSGEDHDMVWRLVRAGWAVRYDPSAVVIHREWRDRWQVVRMQWGYGLGAGAFAAKVAKVDRATGREMLRWRLMTKGLGGTARNLRRGWRRAAIGDALYVCGVAVGALRALPWPVEAGCYKRQ